MAEPLTQGEKQVVFDDIKKEIKRLEALVKEKKVFGAALDLTTVSDYERNGTKYKPITYPCSIHSPWRNRAGIGKVAVYEDPWGGRIYDLTFRAGTVRGAALHVKHS